MKRKVVSVVMAALLLGLTATADYSANVANAAAIKPALSQEVVDSLKGNYGEKSLPDPNETVELLEELTKVKGTPMELERLVEISQKNPKSRTAHSELAQAYWKQYKADSDKSLAKLALEAELKAAKNGLANGQVHYASWIEEMATEAGDLDAAINFFNEALAQYPDDYLTNLHLATTLVKKNDLKKAEQAFEHAKEVRPVGNVDAHAAFAEYLIDQGRYEEAMNNSVLPGEDVLYMHFLTGLALEKQGKGEEAVEYYAKFKEMSQNFPAPQRFKTGSVYQEGIGFEGDVTIQATAATNLSWVIACESGGETLGGMTQVGWSVRQRVNRGSTKVSGATCMYTTNSGTTMDAKYQNVICQSYAYTSLTCNTSKDVTSCVNSNTRTTTSNDVANKVYNGLVPDPYTGYCPTGTKSSTNNCSATCSGATNNTTSWTAKTPHSFLGGTTKRTKPYSCYLEALNVCGNGGSDNWFYYNNANT